MISSVNSGMSMPPPPPSSSQQELSEEQQTLISDTLAEFDPDNLTAADASSIVETFSEAGIQPGKELETALSDWGVDGKTLGDLANVEGAGGNMPPPPPPPSQSSSEISEMASYLDELFEAKGDTEISDEEMQAIYSQVMEKFGIEEGDSLIDTSA